MSSPIFSLQVVFTDSPQKSEGMPTYLSRAFFGAMSRIYRKACLDTAVVGSSQGMNVHADVVSYEVRDLGQVI